jgi:hypothetical protein
MCWNAEVSLNTFIFGIICMTIVIILNKIKYIHILFALTVSLIQLMEYYAWNNINNKEVIYNLSIIGFLILLSQILFLNYGCLNSKDRPIGIILIIIYSIYLFIYNYQNEKFKMEKGENKHLIWHWVDFPIPFLIIILTFYIYPSFRCGYKALMLISIPLLISLYYYYKYNTFGTMWCYYGNIYWIILILISIMKVISK